MCASSAHTTMGNTAVGRNNMNRYCVEKKNSTGWQPVGRHHTIPGAQQIARNIVAYYNVPKNQVRIVVRPLVGMPTASGWAEVDGQPNR